MCRYIYIYIYNVCFFIFFNLKYVFLSWKQVALITLNYHFWPNYIESSVNVVLVMLGCQMFLNCCQMHFQKCKFRSRLHFMRQRKLLPNWGRITLKLMCANMIVCCIGGKMRSWTDVKDATPVGTRSKKRVAVGARNCQGKVCDISHSESDCNGYFCRDKQLSTCVGII